MKIKLNTRGFTLVELLVVIGIIGVLVSLLLPTLSRARQQASFVQCQSNLSQIGKFIFEYTAEEKGYLPYGWGPASLTAQGNSPSGVPLDPSGAAWNWRDALTLMLSKHYAADTVNELTLPSGAPNPYYKGNLFELSLIPVDYPAVFHDTDTPPVGYGVRAADYTCNPRLMPNVARPDPAAYPTGTVPSNPPSWLPLRQISSVQRSSQVMLVWCGSDDLSSGVENDGADAVADQMDGSAIAANAAQFQHGFMYPRAADSFLSNSRGVYGCHISLGNTGALPSITSLGMGPQWYNSSSEPAYLNITSPFEKFVLPQLKYENRDFTNSLSGGFYYCEIRFRHMGNTATAALFVDGHVEPRLIGTVVAGDFCVNPTNVFAGPPPGQNGIPPLP